MTAPSEPEAIRRRLRQLRMDLEAPRREHVLRQSRLNLALPLGPGRDPPTPRQVADLAAARAARDQVLAELAATKAEITTLTAPRKRRSRSRLAVRTSADNAHGRRSKNG